MYVIYVMRSRSSLYTPSNEYLYTLGSLSLSHALSPPRSMFLDLLAIRDLPSLKHAVRMRFDRGRSGAAAAVAGEEKAGARAGALGPRPMRL